MNTALPQWVMVDVTAVCLASSLQGGNSVAAPVAPHLVVHGCGRAISSRHGLDLTGGQVASGVHRLKGAFGVNANPSNTTRGDVIDH